VPGVVENEDREIGVPGGCQYLAGATTTPGRADASGRAADGRAVGIELMQMTFGVSMARRYAPTVAPPSGSMGRVASGTHARDSVLLRRGLWLGALVGRSDRTYVRAMPGQLSSGEREFATLVAQLDALEDEIQAARQVSREARAGRGHDGHVPRETGPALRGERVTLADGAQIVIRPIEPEDVDELSAGFERLGALSRFRRFGQRINRLTRQQLFELTHVDHLSREALVALDAMTGEGVGVARYERVPGDPTRAEVWCTVVDGWQHRGVGSALAERLAARARAAGIECFTALLVLGNQPAHRLLAHVAEDIGEHRDGGTVDVTAQVRRSAP
jgi:RimJ/RimL family protein N-acetyltransferase